MGFPKSERMRQRDQILYAEKLLAKKWNFQTNEVQRMECANKLDETLKNMQKESLSAGAKGENMQNLNIKKTKRPLAKEAPSI